MHTAPSAEFGADRYTYIDGVRHKVGVVRTMRPLDGEDNTAFEQRMDGWAQTLLASGATTVAMEIKRRAGSYVECVFDVTTPPEPAPIVAEMRTCAKPAGVRGRNKT